jgi:hypothetical protein
MEDDEYKKMKEQWETLLRSGTPAVGYEFDLPMTLSREKAGALLLDCPCLRIGNFEPAGIVRIRLTDAAVKSLKAALDFLEKNPGRQGVEMKRQSAN